MKIGLSTKIIIVFFFLTSILFISLIYFSINNQKKNLTDSFIEKAKATAYSLGVGINSEEDLQNKNKLNLSLQKSMWLDADIIGISFNLPQGKDIIVFVSSDLAAINQNSEAENLESFAKDISINKIVQTGTSQILKMIVPIDISGKTEGTIQIDFTLEYVNQKISSEFNNLVLIFLLALSLFLLLIYLITRLVIINPILKINKGVEAIKNNNFDYQIKLGSNDELGNLSNVFDKMAHDLKVFYTSLENKVKERTVELGKKVTELAENNTELEDSKHAIVNLLEDIENEKNKIEETVRIRTKELSDEKSRLAASINSLPFGFAITAVDNSIIFSNSSILKILDMDKPPETILDIVKFFNNFDFIGSCKDCLEMQKTVEIKEVVFAAKFLRIFCAPIMNVTEAIGHVVVIEDITEAKILERSKDEFFSIASHELRTPLTAIRGNADMILDMYLDKISDKDVREMLTDINNASIRLISIVNDFLEMSRLEQGKIETKKEEFELSMIINKVIKVLKPAADKKNIPLVYNLPVNLPKVFADQSQTEEVLTNLIGNAIKFTNKGNITITTEADKKFVTIRVTDTGIGIEKKNQSLLFKKFQQAGSEILARNDSNSTGLGLYISKLLVLNMMGDIKLENSDLASGSTFVFTLPVAV